MADRRTLSQGQMVDQLCRTVYGEESGPVEAVLTSNPGLAAKGLRPGAATDVTLPEMPQADIATPPVTLWD